MSAPAAAWSASSQVGSSAGTGTSSVASSGTRFNGTLEAMTAATESGSATKFHSSLSPGPTASRLTLPSASTTPPMMWTTATRAADDGSAASASATLVSGPAAKIETGCVDSWTTLEMTELAVPVAGPGSASMSDKPHPRSAPVRHASGNARALPAADSRPHATGTSGRPRASRRPRARRRPLAQWMMPVPVTVRARTSNAGSRTRMATASTSLASRSTSMTRGRAPPEVDGPAAGDWEGGGACDVEGVGVEVAAQAPRTTARAPARHRHRR